MKTGVTVKSITVTNFPQMKPLPRTDAMHLEAAHGWLELGDHVSTYDETEKITPQLRAHPDVLELRWKIFAKALKWQDCLSIAETVADVVPRRATSWLLLASTLRSMGQLEDAYNALIEVIDGFEDNAPIRFQLACYAAELGNLQEAKKWLEEAIARDDSKEMKMLALKEKASDALWKDIWQLD